MPQLMTMIDSEASVTKLLEHGLRLYACLQLTASCLLFFFYLRPSVPEGHGPIEYQLAI